MSKPEQFGTNGAEREFVPMLSRTNLTECDIRETSAAASVTNC